MTHDSNDRAGIMGLAATAFEKRERVRMLEMMNTPIDYEERKQAFIDLQLARYEANQAEAALRMLNPYGS
jgi:superfamily II DNA or RNA helicase